MAATNPIPEGIKRKARIEIIPLIDVIFFLLATFVLFTLSLKRIKSIPLQLPVASAMTNSTPNPDMVTIEVSDQGNCYWNRELISVGEIPGRLASYKKAVDDPRVLIAGDDRAKYGSVVAVLDEVRQAGIAEVSVETRTRQTGQ